MSATSDFINRYWGAAQQAGARTGIDPRIILAQAGVESGWGQHYVGNNLFGIKGNGVVAWTSEVIGGVTRRVRQSFQSFSSPEDSFNGYADFILRNPRYRRVINAGDAQAQITAMTRSGYASGAYAGDSLRTAFNTVSSQVGNVSGAAPSIVDTITGAIGNGLRHGIGMITNPLGTAAGDVAASGLDPTGISGFLASISNPSTWARFSAVFIGIILIGLAIAAFVLTSDQSRAAIGKAIPQ